MKWALDSVLAAVAVAVLSPLLLLLALVARVCMGPPVLFRQPRPL